MRRPDLDDVRAALRSEWGLVECRLTPLPLGLNSETWLVETEGRKCVAKLVDARDAASAGFAAAAHLADHGVRSGAPVRSVRDDVLVPVKQSWLALLRHEPGRPLRVDSARDRRLWGEALGRCHRVLAEFEPPEAIERWPWSWLTSESPHLHLEPWILPAVHSASVQATRYVERHQLRQGFLHGDPNPQEFLVDDMGDVAVLDWGSTLRGPLLYDLGSALFFAGGSRRRLDPFLEGYRRNVEIDGPTEDGLRVFLRLRWAAQAWYFAWRVAEDVTTGGDGEFNRTGLAAAQRALAN